MNLKIFKNKDIRVLIICPHPDDGEMLAHQLCIQSIKAGFDTHQLLMCCDEYGTVFDKFKGNRIRKIRRTEMEEAAKRYSKKDSNYSKNGSNNSKNNNNNNNYNNYNNNNSNNNILKLHWANYIDVFVPFNRESVKRLQNFILKIKPDIIAGPDPFLQFDGHPDHLNTGRNYYFALKELYLKNKKDYFPKLCLFFQTSKPDFFLPVMYINTIMHARAAHQSQFSPLLLKLMKVMNWVFYLINLPKTGKIKTQGYRIVKFTNDSHKCNSLIQKIIYYTMGKPQNKMRELTPPTPEELGLVIKPTGDIK